MQTQRCTFEWPPSFVILFLVLADLAESYQMGRSLLLIACSHPSGLGSRTPAPQHAAPIHLPARTPDVGTSLSSAALCTRSIPQLSLNGAHASGVTPVDGTHMNVNAGGRQPGGGYAGRKGARTSLSERLVRRKQGRPWSKGWGSPQRQKRRAREAAAHEATDYVGRFAKQARRHAARRCGAAEGLCARFQGLARHPAA
jgi:hypothetical protein